MVGSLAAYIVLGVLSFVPPTLGGGARSGGGTDPRFFISSGSAVTVNSSVITWVSAIVGALMLGSLLYIAYASVGGAAVPPGGYSGGGHRYKRTTFEQCESRSITNYHYYVQTHIACRDF